MTDRDTFAAAALTGLLSNIPRYQLGVIAVQAYDIADEMLRERLRNSEAESRETAKQLKDAEDFVAIRKQFEAWQKEQSVGVAEMDSVADRKSVATPRACASSRSQPFDSAPTTHDAAPEAKASKCGGTSHDAVGTGNTTEPVAWCVRYAHCDTGVVDLCRTLAECRDKWSNRATDHWRYVPLYSQPQPTLADEEREAITCAADLLIGSRPGATLRNLLARLHT